MARNRGKNISRAIHEAVDSRRALVVRYRLRYKFGAERIVEVMEAEHGIRMTRKQVYDDMLESRREWKAARMQAHDQHRDETMAMLDAVEAEAWEAWEESKKARDPVTGVPLLVNMQRVKTPGDWRFLEIVRQARKDRREMLGLDAPKMVAGAFAGLNAEQWFRYVKDAMKNPQPELPAPGELLEEPPDGDPQE